MRVETGLDRFLGEGPACAGLPVGSRIGLLAHAASVDRLAYHAVERLAADPRVRLTRLFAPEHGLWGHEQDMERVRDSVDPVSGLDVVSLYGSGPASLRPPASSLEDLDALLVDLQDVGSRYYTYVYTLSYAMEAAAERSIPVVVLDRPNPIGGDRVEGPVLDPAFSSFVGRYPLPVRHGLTIGELATLFRSEFAIGGDVRVVPLAGWDRAAGIEAAGLPWVPPSPNMPTPATARVYPGGCLLEGTNLSEGRGTTLPFELAGAPWLAAVALAERMRAAALPGVTFRAASFRPMFQKHDGRACGGVQVIVTDTVAFRPFATYLALITEARRLAPDRFDWRREVYEFETRRLAIDLLLGCDNLRPMIEEGTRWEEMEQEWQAGLRDFLAIRAAYLLYEGTT